MLFFFCVFIFELAIILFFIPSNIRGIILGIVGELLLVALVAGIIFGIRKGKNEIGMKLTMKIFLGIVGVIILIILITPLIPQFFLLLTKVLSILW